MGEKRGPRNPRLSAVPEDGVTSDARERPPVSWDRMILKEEQAAEFLKLPRTTFRTKAAAGEFSRYPVTDGTYRYYVYDLLDWLIAKGSAV